MKTKTLLLIFAILGISLLAFLSFSRKGDNPPPGNGFALIELYTSEGCSSCPPAESLVAAMQAEQQGKPVYFLSYHVDYWNRLGWTDTYSKPAFSSRQRQFAGLLHTGVYTPQMVVNGETAFVGSNRDALQRAIDASLARKADQRLSLNAKISGPRQLTINYQANNAPENSAVYLALVRKRASSSVKSGENAGRRLNHINVVETLNNTPLTNAGGSIKIDLSSRETDGLILVGFIQDKSSGRIGAATECTLPPYF